jgi:hypothetical protein
VAEQRLDDANVGAALQQVGGKAVPQSMYGDALAEARCGTCRAAGGMQHNGVDRMAGITPGKQPVRRPRQAPIGAQDAEKLRRQHDVAITTALALLDADDHAAAVDVGDPEARRFGSAQSGRIRRGQRGPTFRLGTASRNCTTSSAPSTTGNFCGARAYGIRSGRSVCLSVTPYKK